MIGSAGFGRSTRDRIKAGFFELMVQEEQRRTERIQLRIPIRVVTFSDSSEEFSEDTFTLELNRTGARIAVKRKLFADDVVRIINLENYREADFRVVGPLRSADGQDMEWGVECVEADRNIWGIEFPPPVGSATAAALLECRQCHTQAPPALKLVEVDVLDSTGIIAGSCTACGKTTYWTYADATRRPREFAPSEPVTPSKHHEAEVAAKAKEKVEKRTDKRLAMKMPILVRNSLGDEEIAKTENISKRGVAVSFEINIAMGETVKIVCPYTGGGGNVAEG